MKSDWSPSPQDGYIEHLERELIAARQASVKAEAVFRAICRVADRGESDIRGIPWQEIQEWLALWGRAGKIGAIDILEPHERDQFTAEGERYLRMRGK